MPDKVERYICCWCHLTPKEQYPRIEADGRMALLKQGGSTMGLWNIPAKGEACSYHHIGFLKSYRCFHLPQIMSTSKLSIFHASLQSRLIWVSFVQRMLFQGQCDCLRCSFWQPGLSFAESFESLPPFKGIQVFLCCRAHQRVPTCWFYTPKMLQLSLWWICFLKESLRWEPKCKGHIWYQVYTVNWLIDEKLIKN